MPDTRPDVPGKGAEARISSGPAFGPGYEPAAIGFIGLGDQGLPMATAIAEAGYSLHAWARRPASLDGLAGFTSGFWICAIVAAVSLVIAAAISGPHQAGVTVFNRGGMAILRRQAVLDRDEHHAQLRGSGESLTGALPAVGAVHPCHHRA